MKLCYCGTVILGKTTDTLTFKCGACGMFVPPDPEDTLLFERKEGNAIDRHTNTIRNIAHDRMNPRQIMKCNGCKKDTMVAYAVISDDMIIVYECLNCNHSWSGSSTT